MRLFSDKKYLETIDKIKECLLLDPDNCVYNSSIHFNIAISYDNLGQGENAINELDKAIQLNPKY